MPFITPFHLHSSQTSPVRPRRSSPPPSTAPGPEIVACPSQSTFCGGRGAENISYCDCQAGTYKLPEGSCAETFFFFFFKWFD
eukprot:2914814-Rhodomonas_salina.5